MPYVSLKCHIRGIAPLLMHNGHLADPLNEFTRAIKAITAKRKKTDADFEQIAKLEFLGGLYLDRNGAPAVPGELIEGLLRDGAKKSRQGKDAQCGLISDGVWPLTYKGPKDQEALWADENFRDIRGVVIKGSRIMRMRPRFPVWDLNFEVMFQDEVANDDQINKWLVDAGQFVGLGDFRPRFGRFTVESVKFA